MGLGFSCLSDKKIIGSMLGVIQIYFKNKLTDSFVEYLTAWFLAAPYQSCARLPGSASRNGLLEASERSA